MQPFEYYSQPKIIEKIVEFCRDREVAGMTFQGIYGTRPNVILYPSDFRTIASEFHSFHASLERWNNPMTLGTGVNLDELRKGWDLVIDLDGKNFELIRSCGLLVVEALKAHGVNSVSAKFSGNKGFHIGVPFEAFPQKVDNTPTKRLFPELPRQIAAYLQSFIEEEFRNEISSKMTEKEYAEKLGVKLEEVLVDGRINPWAGVNIDTILVSPRHMIRVPYSLHSKSGLASLPIEIREIKKFNKEDAKPEKVKPKLEFLQRTAVENEAVELVSLAMSYKKSEKKIILEERKVERPTTRLEQEDFAPCIRKILEGLKDGRKRSEFILRCFLWRCGWNWDQIKDLLLEWNKKNPEPLNENYLLGQLRWHMRQNRNIMPPNCDNKQYYLEMGVCQPDKFCKDAKNPVVSSFRRMTSNNESKGSKPNQRVRLDQNSTGVG